MTVVADSYFCDVEDVYTFSGAPMLAIAVGVNQHYEQNTVEKNHSGKDRYAIWEHASDQSVETEDGMIGVAVVMPEAQMICMTTDHSHALLLKGVSSGDSLHYKFGSCWSKGDIKTAEEWFKLVDEQ